jgi:hypothetical protein
LEKRNIPVATICTDEFFALGKAEAEFLGVPGLPIAVIPHPMAGQPPQRVAEIAEHSFDEIVHILTGDAKLLVDEYKDKAVKGARKKKRLRHKSLFGDEFSISESDDTVRAPDSLDAVNRIFYHRGWTDGMPIIPPTEERVDQMLGDWCLNEDTAIGTIAPRGGAATVKKIAANAVMAGCLPEHLPVVVAATRAMIQKEFNLYAVQTTTHPVTVLTLVNGPLAYDLDFNCSYNAMGQGSLSNAAVGRAIRLLLVNVGGASPGVLDRATLGSPAKYAFCFAENETESPWDPFHAERGFSESVSTVTVMGVEGPHNVNDHGGETGEEILLTVTGVLSNPGINNVYLNGEPLIVLGLEHATIIARDGFSKQAVKQFIFEKARVPLRWVSKGNMKWFTRHNPQRFSHLKVGDEIPIVDRAEDIMVVVAGGMGRHSAVIPTFGGHSRAVTVPIFDSHGEHILADSAVKNKKGKR